jgi:hypothetical protein
MLLVHGMLAPSPSNSNVCGPKGGTLFQVGKMEEWLGGDSILRTRCGDGEEEFQVLGGSLP